MVREMKSWISQGRAGPVMAEAETSLGGNNINLRYPLPASLRCLGPGDFNAPTAKQACDASCQPVDGMRILKRAQGIPFTA